MKTIPRRKISELCFLYDRHPKRRDIYVEGSFDAAIIRWFFRAAGVASTVVYEISTVDIPEEEVLRMGLKGNNRGRVINLAFIAVDRYGINAEQQVTCFVDADFSYVLEDIMKNPCLVYTDYACMESYFIDSVNIEKLITIYYERNDWPIDIILSTISSVLSELFLLRMANETLGWYMDWLDKIVCMKLNGWMISFDADDYIFRYLSKNRRYSQKDEFMQKVSQLRKRLKSDHRFHINGHDFAALFVWYLREKKIGVDAHTHENLHRELALCMDYKSLTNHPSFARLLIRAQ